MASNTDYLPDEITYGFIADRVLLAVGDTTSDDNRYPDGVPAQGTVRFSPERTILYTQQRPATVLPQDIECTIYHRDHPVAKEQGYEPELVGKLVDPAGHVGNVALIVGWYDVVYRLSTGTAQRFRFQVKPEHTADNPLWLPEVAPLQPTPSERFVVNEQVYNTTLAARDETETFRNHAEGYRDETIAARDLVLPARDQTLAARDQTLAARDETLQHGITVDTSVGTRVFVGDTMIYGDTGWRKVPPHESWSEDSTCLIRRVNQTVTLNFSGRWLGDPQDIASTRHLVGTITGFRPPGYLTLGIGSRVNSGGTILNTGEVGMYSSGSYISLYRLGGQGEWQQGDRARTYIAWTVVESWPTVLPGTPA